MLPDAYIFAAPKRGIYTLLNICPTGQRDVATLKLIADGFMEEPSPI
jgi:hypothetical protein